MSVAQLSNHKLVIGASYVSSNSSEKKLVTIDLSGKTDAHMNEGINGSVFAYHIHEEIYVGNDTSAKDAVLWQLGVKFETKAYVSFALNEAAQYG